MQGTWSANEERPESPMATGAGWYALPKGKTGKSWLPAVRKTFEHLVQQYELALLCEAFDEKTKKDVIFTQISSLIYDALDINEQNEDGNTFLHIAVAMQSLQVVDLLLTHPTIRLTIKNKLRLTPYDLACGLEGGSANPIAMALTARDSGIAVSTGNSALFKWLISLYFPANTLLEILLRDQDINNINTDHHTALQTLCCINFETVRAKLTTSEAFNDYMIDYERVFKFILGHPELQINKLEHKRGKSALSLAFQNKNMIAIKSLIDHPGVNLYQIDSKNRNILHILCCTSDAYFSEMFHHIAHLTSDPGFLNQRDHLGKTPLFYAYEKKLTCAVQKLLENPLVEVNIPDIHGDTPLHIIARKNDIETVNLLFKYRRLNPDIQNFKGETAYNIRHAKMEWMHNHMIWCAKTLKFKEFGTEEFGGSDYGSDKMLNIFNTPFRHPDGFIDDHFAHPSRIPSAFLKNQPRWWNLQN